MYPGSLVFFSSFLFFSIVVVNSYFCFGFYCAVAASNNHHREDGYQLEAAPEATSSPNAQRLRKSTTAKTTATATATSLDGGRRPPLRADLTAEADATRRVVDVTKSSSAVANIKNERQQPFVTASGTTGRDGGDDPTATASVTGVHLPIPVHHKPVVG